MNIKNLRKANASFTVYILWIFTVSMIFSERLSGPLLPVLTPLLITLPPAIVVGSIMGGFKKNNILTSSSNEKFNPLFLLSALMVGFAIKCLSDAVLLLVFNDRESVFSFMKFSWLSFVGLVFIAPISEELFFRGALLNTLHNASNKFKIFFTALLFSLFHLDIQSFVPTFLLGIVLGLVMVKYKSLVLSIVVHSIYNASVYLSNTVLFDSASLFTLFLITFVSALSLFYVFKELIIVCKVQNTVDSNVLVGGLNTLYRTKEKVNITSFTGLLLPVIIYIMLNFRYL